HDHGEQREPCSDAQPARQQVGGEGRDARSGHYGDRSGRRRAHLHEDGGPDVHDGDDHQRDDRQHPQIGRASRREGDWARSGARRGCDWGSVDDTKGLTITVNNVNRAPVLNQPTNMTVAEGATADQVITGTDPDGDALTFTKTAGPTYMTVTTTNATTGNIHLAPGFTDSGTAAATVQASDGSLTNSKTLTITVNNTNRAPVLAQPANMTVNEGATADQALSATDADGQALTFSLASGPTYASVTTTTPGTGTAA